MWRESKKDITKNNASTFMKEPVSNSLCKSRGRKSNSKYEGKALKITVMIAQITKYYCQTIIGIRNVACIQIEYFLVTKKGRFL